MAPISLTASTERASRSLVLRKKRPRTLSRGCANELYRYQPGGSAGYNGGNSADALSDAEVCQRDAVVLQKLGVNSIRVYNLNPKQDHTACASIFNAAGIYMIIDVNSPLDGESLNRVEPWTTYNEGYLGRTFEVVSAFMNFPNTLAFFSGNEVINEDSHADAPRYMRAVTRDIKQYIKTHASREIPVGYSAADVRPLLAGTYDYMACALGNDTTSSKIDFFGLNSYAWCGRSNMEDAEYDVLIERFGNSTIPIFMSEYGCNQVTPRVFTEVEALYSAEMTGTFSGGVVYEYSQEKNNFGLVEIDGSGDLELLVDYDNFQNQLNQLDMARLTATNRTATDRTAPDCTLEMIGTANFTQSYFVPEQLSEIADLIKNGVKGDWPTGVTPVTETSVGHTVTDSNGQQISSLSLTVLADDKSNAPNGETLTTGNRVDIGQADEGTGSGNGTSGGAQADAAGRVGSAQVTLLSLGALALGMALL